MSMQQLDSALFIEKPLRADIDLSSFSCSNDDLNEYLKDDALRDSKFLYSITKVIQYNNTIVGYFTLVADTINPKFVDEEIGKKYEYAKLPAIKIARLATDQKYVGKGIGSIMIGCVYRIALNMIKDMGCRVITVDAKKEAQTFYEHVGFQVAKKKESETILMYFDIKTLADSISE